MSSRRIVVQAPGAAVIEAFIEDPDTGELMVLRLITDDARRLRDGLSIAIEVQDALDLAERARDRLEVCNSGEGHAARMAATARGGIALVAAPVETAAAPAVDTRRWVREAVQVLGSQQKLAAATGYSQARINGLCNTDSPCSPDIAVAIESATAGIVPRWKVRPDLWDAPADAAGDNGADA